MNNLQLSCLHTSINLWNRNFIQKFIIPHLHNRITTQRLSWILSTLQVCARECVHACVFVVTRVAFRQFFSEYCSFALSVSFHWCYMFPFHSTRCYIIWQNWKHCKKMLMPSLLLQWKKGRGGSATGGGSSGDGGSSCSALLFMYLHQDLWAFVPN